MVEWELSCKGMMVVCIVPALDNEREYINGQSLTHLIYETCKTTTRVRKQNEVQKKKASKVSLEVV